MPNTGVLASLRSKILKSEGAIFDNDGTFVHTMPLHYRAWRTAMESHGLSFTEEEFYARAGATARDIVTSANASQGKSAQVDKVLSTKAEVLSAKMGSVRVIDVVMDLAEHAKANGIPIAIASGGRRDTVLASLRAAGIDPLQYFQAVVTADDVTQGKPHPETFLLAARQLGVHPARCIGFEDGELGLQALRSAGIADVDVRTLPGYPLPDFAKKE